MDPIIDIFWPEPKSHHYIMSQKDRTAPFLCNLYPRLPPNPYTRNLIIGASGQVGGALIEALGRKNCIGT